MTIVVLCVRDPDALNEYTIEPTDADVEIIDIDLGYADLIDWEEFHPWAYKHLRTANGLPEGTGQRLTGGGVRKVIEDTVWTVFEDNAQYFDHKWPSVRADITDLGRNVPDSLKAVDGVDHLFTLLRYMNGD